MSRTGRDQRTGVLTSPYRLAIPVSTVDPRLTGGLVSSSAQALRTTSARPGHGFPVRRQRQTTSARRLVRAETQQSLDVAERGWRTAWGSEVRTCEVVVRRGSVPDVGSVVDGPSSVRR